MKAEGSQEVWGECGQLYVVWGALWGAGGWKHYGGLEMLQQTGGHSGRLGVTVKVEGTQEV